MIIGIGNDLVDIRRIEDALARHGQRFKDRCFTPAEQEKATRRRSGGIEADTYAKRFAAKEACSKALGTGMSKGVRFKDIEVINDADGVPRLRLHGRAHQRLQALTPEHMEARIHLSFSDEPPYAQAFVVIESQMA